MATEDPIEEVTNIAKRAVKMYYRGDKNDRAGAIDAARLAIRMWARKNRDFKGKLPDPSQIVDEVEQELEMK